MSKLYEKILRAQQSIERVAKNGRNTFHNYDYVTEADILDQVLDKLNAAGLVCFASTVEADSGQLESGARWAKVLIDLTVVDPETGDSVKARMPGYAEDKGDKALYKALTGANKYAYLKFFGVSTGDDPEKETEKESVASKPPITPIKKPTLTNEDEHQKQLQPLMKELSRFMNKYGREQVAAITGYPTWMGLPISDFQEGLRRLREHQTAEEQEKKAG